MKISQHLLKYLTGIALTLMMLSCQNSTRNLLSQQQQDWLKQNEGKIEVLCGYQAPPNAFHDDNGDYVGFTVDYQKEIEIQLGQDFVFRNFETCAQKFR